MKNSLLKTGLCAALALLIGCGTSAQTASNDDAVTPTQVVPPFVNSIVSTDFDFITINDPSAFQCLGYLGQETKEMVDSRSDKLMLDGTYVFEMNFTDGTNVEIWASPEFGSVGAARKEVENFKGPLGKLPTFMRDTLDHVVFHKGDETAFSEHEGHFIVVYSENMELRRSQHDMEETIFHESVHASIDAKHMKNKNWLSAQKADGNFITKYAMDYPDREDLAESSIFVYTAMYHPERLGSEIVAKIEDLIPNRKVYLEKVFAKDRLNYSVGAVESCN